MYTRYAKTPVSYTRKYVEEMKRELSLDIDDRTAKKLYDERYRYFEILDVCVDMNLYLLILSLRATSEIDKRAHLHVNDGLVGYGRAAMQEMIVIRLRDLFQAKKDEPDKFRFYGFHQTLQELGGASYPMPNLKTNNAIARIIHRRRFYSAHHGDGKNEHSFTKNRLRPLDLFTAMSYIAKVEDSLYGGKLYDPFERLLNDELGDELQVLCGVYEVVTGQGYEARNYTGVLETLPDGTKVVNGEYLDTPEFATYQSKAKEELQKIRAKISEMIG